MPNQFKRKISGPSSFRMDRQKNMKRVKALRDSGQLKRDNPLSKLHNSIKGALGSLSRKTDSSATRVIQGPKIKQLSSPTAKEAGNKLIKAGQAAVNKAKTPKATTTPPSQKTSAETELVRRPNETATSFIMRKARAKAKARREAFSRNR